MDAQGVKSAIRRHSAGRFLFDHTVLVLALLLVASVAAAFWYLTRLQAELISTLAQQGTRLQSETFEELRSLYTSDVVERVRTHGVSVTHDYKDHDNAIPLPATLTIELGQRIGARGSGMSVRLYSDYPFPWRTKEGGARDAFEREALAALRQNPEQPFSRFEEYQGGQVLRFAVADRMRPQCLSCHNTHPASPKKDWKEGDVRGVLEIIRPIAPIAAAAQTGLQGSFAAMSLVVVLGLAGIGLASSKQRLYARGLAREIIERKRAEAELTANAARLSAMDEASPLGSFVADADGRCLHVNATYQRITGYPAEAMIGANWYAGIDPVDRDRVLSEWRDASQNDLTFATECSFLRADGSTTWISCKAAAMRDGQRLLGYVGTFEDISDRKRVERMKNEFISTVSHELRTPLTSIMGALGLLEGGVAGGLADEAKKLIGIAHKNSERLVRLISDILDIEKIESGAMHFDLQPRELQHLIEQAVAANHHYAELFGVTFAIVERLPGVMAKMDSDRLMQVMTNLMSNAAKFSPRGGTVELRLMRQGSTIRFSVTDHGPGIPEDFHSKMFQKFSQADASDSRQKGGTGLGLSISKAIVEHMGGTIGFETARGVGTTFHVDLPEWREAADALVATAGEAEPFQPKVLVCEDDRDVAALISMMLKNAGYHPVPAYDAATARRLLAEDNFVAMTLDIRLPDMDGKAFMRELRSSPATHELPIVVVSVHPRAPQQQGVIDGLGVIDWLSKPIDQERLIEAMRRGTQHPADGKIRVLHVEDDPDVCQIVQSLAGGIAQVQPAASFQEARHLLSSQRFDLVILDIELPDGSGWDLLPLIEAQFPPLPVLVFSAQTVSSKESGRVAAALVKSHATNPEILGAILALAGRSR